MQYYKGKGEHSVRQLESMIEERNELDYQVKSLLWVIANQREKVKGNVKHIVDLVYPKYDDDTKWDIVEKVLKNIK